MVNVNVKMNIENIKIEVFPDGRMDDINTAKYAKTTVKTLAKMRSLGTGPRFYKAGGNGRPFYYTDDVDDWIKAGGKLKKSSEARRLDK